MDNSIGDERKTANLFSVSAFYASTTAAAGRGVGFKLNLSAGISDLSARS